MSRALTAPDYEYDVVYVRRSASVALPELSRVEITCEVRTDEGVTIPSGSIGTIVGTWAGGEAYEVEFARPVNGLATVEAHSLKVSEDAR